MVYPLGPESTRRRILRPEFRLYKWYGAWDDLNMAGFEGSTRQDMYHERSMAVGELPTTVPVETGILGILNVSIPRISSPYGAQFSSYG